MKISERTHYIFEHLNNGNFCKKDFYEYYRIKNTIECAGWYIANKSEIEKNIKIVSIPFLDAILKSGEKIELRKLYNDIKQSSGILVVDKAAYVYKVNEDKSISFYFIHGHSLLLASVSGYRNNGLHMNDVSINTIDVPAYLQNHNIGINEFVNMQVMFLISALLFIQYAEVETKYIPANSKVKGIDCKYVNDTNCNITYLDSKWFTTLVKSDAFKVRGHFRLQAHGEGMKERKLIWINDFEKTGYTAPARKLNTHRKHNDDE